MGGRRNKGGSEPPALNLVDALNLAWDLEHKAEACATRSELEAAVKEATKRRSEDEAAAIYRHMLYAWLRTPQGRPWALKILRVAEGGR